MTPRVPKVKGWKESSGASVSLLMADFFDYLLLCLLSRYKEAFVPMKFLLPPDEYIEVI